MHSIDRLFVATEIAIVKGTITKLKSKSKGVHIIWQWPNMFRSLEDAIKDVAFNELNIKKMAIYCPTNSTTHMYICTI